MESERVSLPLIHQHSMVPWNDMGKGDCCGGFEAITDGFYCEICDFFVHKKCSEFSKYIQHPSHSGHTLQIQRNNLNCICNLCGKKNKNLFYRCQICDFDIDLYCLKYPPPEVIDVSETHHHKLTLLKERINKFHCKAKNCGNTGRFEFPYRCEECDLTFHVDCVWHPVKHPLEYTTIDAGERVSLPWIHNHFMLPWNDLKKGDCCGRFESVSDGYYCQRCDVFFHKKCSNTTSESIQHPSHSLHPLWLQSAPAYNSCDICGKRIVDLFYRCEICHFNVDLHCATYPPPEVIDVSETHQHKLTLLLCYKQFDCDAKNCGKTAYCEFSYRCEECDIDFHVDCVWHPSEAKHTLEVNHSYHPLHPLKLYMGQLPDYSDGKCRLCGNEIDRRLFYHCSTCNFSLDMRCVLKPPPQSLLHLKAHDHQLTLLPRLDSFTCNACGLKGDQSPYICVQCGFMIHQDCLNLPRVININRHDHRISRTSLLGVVNSVCGVCHKKVDWIYGGYSCQRCPSYVVHSKCATREDVWNGKELEGVPEEVEDIEPYVVNDDNTIQHFSHKEHNLRLDVNGVLYEESKRCRACIQPIGFQSFYGCLDCDFILHQKCAQLPKKRWHALHNDRLTLVTSEVDVFCCYGCRRLSNGFRYQHLDKKIEVRCISISEPFLHPSHPDHPLYYMLRGELEICNVCKEWGLPMLISHMLMCIEDGCEFFLCFKCAALPKVVKHRVDDHPLSLCYGGEEESGKCWCDICEKESDPRNEWFYTCKDHRACLHTKCVLGRYAGFMPRSTIKEWGKPVEVVLNNSVTRPICWYCKKRCMDPIIFKLIGSSDTYFCRLECSVFFPLFSSHGHQIC